MSPKIINKEEKKRVILLAAMTVLSQKGYHATKMADIATAAGIGKGTIYEYFRTKEELPKALLEILFIDFEARLKELESNPVDCIEAILSGIRLSFADLELYADFMPVIFELLGAKELNRSLGLTETMNYWFESLSIFFLKLIDKGQKQGRIDSSINPKAFARMLVSAVDGIVLHYCLFRPSLSFFQNQELELEKTIRKTLAKPENNDSE